MYFAFFLSIHTKWRRYSYPEDSWKGKMKFVWKCACVVSEQRQEVIGNADRGTKWLGVNWIHRWVQGEGRICLEGRSVINKADHWCRSYRCWHVLHFIKCKKIITFNTTIELTSTAFQCWETVKVHSGRYKLSKILIFIPILSLATDSCWLLPSKWESCFVWFWENVIHIPKSDWLVCELFFQVQGLIWGKANGWVSLEL